jgi:hypothetical protein
MSTHPVAVVLAYAERLRATIPKEDFDFQRAKQFDHNPLLMLYRVIQHAALVESWYLVPVEFETA